MVEIHAARTSLTRNRSGADVTTCFMYHLRAADEEVAFERSAYSSMRSPTSGSRSFFGANRERIHVATLSAR
jgi:hypothetical protein